MELQQSINILRTEKANGITSRFPCRVLLLHSREDYCNAVSSLKSLCDRAVSSDELFSGADVMPAYDNLLGTIKSNEWVGLASRRQRIPAAVLQKRATYRTVC